jgi:hypothetical protein
VAAVGTGVYRDYDELRDMLRRKNAGRGVTEPDAGLRPLYDERYRSYLACYPRLKDIMHGLGNGTPLDRKG